MLVIPHVPSPFLRLEAEAVKEGGAIAPKLVDIIL
jgi:hypothetical protein